MGRAIKGPGNALFSSAAVKFGVIFSPLLWACGPASVSDPAFWEPYRGGGGAPANGGSEGGSGGVAGAGGSGGGSVVASTGSGSGGSTPTIGTLSFSFTTASMGGEFAPKNIGAVWISDEQDVFVKTLAVWANKRAKHLVNWGSASGQNVVDAITGATRKTHGAHTAVWSATGTNGTVVPDGVYHIHVELTESNSSEPGQPAGAHSIVTFEKGPTPVSEMLPDETTFLMREITWTP